MGKKSPKSKHADQAEWIDAGALQAYRQRKADLEEIFAQNMRMLREQSMRIEREMFAKNLDGKHDPTLNAAAVRTAKAIESLAKLQKQLVTEGRRVASNMTFEDKVAAFIDMLYEQGRNNQNKARRMLDEWEADVLRERREAREARDPRKSTPDE